VRAAFRLAPYIVRLWRVADRVDVFHIMANSGWSWHLAAAPAVWVARLRGIPSVVNYRGGEAEAFLNRSGALVTLTLRRATALAVPSGFLQRVFERWGLRSTIVPNIIDTERFRPGAPDQNRSSPHLVVPRNLEPIYDIGTALRAFATIRAAWPGAKMTVAGSGPERQALQSLSAALGVLDAVDFCGRLDRDRMAQLYRTASVVINPSRVDNMPNSVLEAMASGAPVVSTNVGGVPFIARDGVSALLVPAGDHSAMATAVLRLLADPACARRVRDAAMHDVQQYTWPRVRPCWAELYALATRKTAANIMPI
jgi:glycosyltransferase involved in cell wall biosynthesis